MDNEELFNVIENRLYHLKPPYPSIPSQPTQSSSPPNSTPPASTTLEIPFPCSILLAIHPIGSWIIKFHKSSIIINDHDLIFHNLVTFHATITFHSLDSFWSMANSNSHHKNYEDEIKSHSDITYSGTWEYIAILLTLLHDTTTRLPHENGRRYSIAGSGSTTPMSVSGHGNSNGGNGNGGINKNKKSTKEKMSEGTKSIKSGWMYKKRDIIAGWRLRYFKLYVGRIEYYTDQSALIPRGIIPLIGAEVVGPKVCTVNGDDDHWSITVEPRHRDKSFKISSERSGLEGKAEMESWIQTIRESARLGDPLSASFAYSSNDISPRKRSGSTASNTRVSPQTSHHFFTSPVTSSVSSSSDIPSISLPPTEQQQQQRQSDSSTSSTNTANTVQKKLHHLTSTLTSQESLEELQRQKHLVLLFLLLLLLGIALGGVYLHSNHTTDPLLSSSSLSSSSLSSSSHTSTPSSYLLSSSIILTLGGAVCCGLLLLFYLSQHISHKDSQKQN